MSSFPFRKKRILTKHIGETPLQVIDRFKASHPRYTDVPATYAGRLDPMASGKLLVLFGEECKKKDQYTKLDKQYVVEILLDIGSDTGDVLGIVSEEDGRQTVVRRKEILEKLKKEIGTFTRKYPAYSSKTVNGRPLFLYALEGTLDSIEIPAHDETIFSISLLDIQSVTTSLLKTHIRNTLSLAPVSLEASKVLGANFRIEHVTKSWASALKEDRNYYVVKLKVACGSGAYMRTLAERIGVALGTKALALSIHRTHIGRRNILW